ncbi:hypothetical protein TTHERM_00241750 (macronuclear) [Tetrahymena thermophila SB210]|uniref:Uncharacterized protein n=1 Tax=Tetrahymena thermophila (strain SB210) TaxID=312017 RepID=I7M404_TETTS|nr:hypothetical protein TTHERM_00241750 [Tetrahymena thermophila SB210]EAS04654.2 hypothetical protein TTHERM_00241750 [Tetrahymena thermophila SB210]|eukprot:XP_001024899.2 hypothetical protein TTHERM_00241750 [Tetrahymena thermophila SB210]
MIESNSQSPERRQQGGGTKIMSIKNVIAKSHQANQNLKQNEITKLQKFKGQFENVRSRALMNIEQGGGEHFKKQIKYKLNVDTDSEEETAHENSQRLKSKASKDSNNNQNAYFEAQMTLGAEQTKAKQNTNLLFNNFDKASQIIPARMNLKKIIQNDQKIQPASSPTAQQTSLGQTYSLNVQAQNTLANQGTSQTSYPSQGDNSTNLKLQKIMNLAALNNSNYEDSPNMAGTEENVSYLKGLSQNQNLPNNCELIEYVDSDKITIGIKTTDFFTFIRLQDEVDELRRKHNQFQLQKELIQQQRIQQNKQYKTQVFNENQEIQSPSHTISQSNQKSGNKQTILQNIKNSPLLNSSQQAATKQNLFAANQEQEANNEPEATNNKKEGQKIFQFYVARKYGMQWHKKMTQIIKNRINKQNVQNQSQKINQNKQFTEENYSNLSSLHENTIEKI